MSAVANLPVQIVCSKPVVISGDTIRCAETGAIHLAGIRAPACTSSGRCSAGRAEDARLGLEWTLGYGPITISHARVDHGGSVIAIASIGGRNLSCWQLGWKLATYAPARDKDGWISRTCARNIRGKKGAGM